MLDVFGLFLGQGLAVFPVTPLVALFPIAHLLAVIAAIVFVLAAVVNEVEVVPFLHGDGETGAVLLHLGQFDDLVLVAAVPFPVAVSKIATINVVVVIGEIVEVASLTSPALHVAGNVPIPLGEACTPFLSGVNPSEISHLRFSLDSTRKYYLREPFPESVCARSSWNYLSFTDSIILTKELL